MFDLSWIWRNLFNWIISQFPHIYENLHTNYHYQWHFQWVSLIIKFDNIFFFINFSYHICVSSTTPYVFGGRRDSAEWVTARQMNLTGKRGNYAFTTFAKQEFRDGKRNKIESLQQRHENIHIFYTNQIVDEKCYTKKVRVLCF